MPNLHVFFFLLSVWIFFFFYNSNDTTGRKQKYANSHLTFERIKLELWKNLPIRKELVTIAAPQVAKFGSYQHYLEN